MQETEHKPIEYGIGHLAAIPVRKHPFHSSEMTSQVLFGETFAVTEKYHNFRRVKCSFDNYTGWVHESCYQVISEETYVSVSNMPTAISTDLVQVMLDHTRNRMFPVLIGSSLPGLKDQAFEIGGIQYSFEGAVNLPGIGTHCRKMVENAYMYLHSPYLWGGRMPFGIDCSGFIQMVFKLCGIPLLRDSTQQATQGEIVNLLSEAHPGDLAFFDNDEWEITHVGILLDRQTIIHASGKVRTDRIDHHGIFNDEIKQYSHKLRLIRRVL
jgi:gamma-D-glutamyl-L-lysine dipeptidyl-peptidase